MLQTPIRSLALTTVAALALAGCAKAPPPAPPPPSVGYITATLAPVTLTTELPGKISALETSDVRPQISGVVRSRLFQEGAIVHAGQVLYVIEDAPYRAAVLNAQGQLANANASIQSTQAQSQRYHQLVTANAVSKQDSENADASAAQARASVVTARGSLLSEQVNEGFTRIRAPISGRIGRSLVTPGALVQTGQADALATIQHIDTVYVDLTQSAAQLLDLKAALAAGSVSKASPSSARVQLVLPNGQIYPIEGRLQFTDVTVDANTGSVTLRATFANPNAMLLPGLFVRARIVEGVQAQALLVPQVGITRNERGQAVALVLGAKNVVEQRIVTTGQTVGNSWLVTSGLKAGDRVIVEGLVGVMPGANVTAHPAKPTPESDTPGSAPATPAGTHS